MISLSDSKMKVELTQAHNLWSKHESQIRNKETEANHNFPSKATKRN